MQPMAYNVQRLYRWIAAETDEEYPGECVRVFSRDSYPVSLHLTPMPRILTRSESGFSAEESRIRVYNPDRSVLFEPGDRIGDADKVLYEVMDVENYQTHQTFILRMVSADE